MDRNFSQGSARIYQFPAGGRSALCGKRYEEYKKPAADQLAVRFNETACSGSWYHEAAIREAEYGRDH